jgi:hypothetical protein
MLSHRSELKIAFSPPYPYHIWDFAFLYFWLVLLILYVQLYCIGKNITYDTMIHDTVPVPYHTNTVRYDISHGSTTALLGKRKKGKHTKKDDCPAHFLL